MARIKAGGEPASDLPRDPPDQLRAYADYLRKLIAWLESGCDPRMA